jgi:hypothetical protein
VLALFTDSVGDKGVCLGATDFSRGERVLSGEGRPPDVGGEEDTGRGILLGVWGEVTFSGVRTLREKIEHELESIGNNRFFKVYFLHISARIFSQIYYYKYILFKTVANISHRVYKCVYLATLHYVPEFVLGLFVGLRTGIRL